jgi:hypothetical protein
MNRPLNELVNEGREMFGGEKSNGKKMAFGSASFVPMGQAVTFPELTTIVSRNQGIMVKATTFGGPNKATVEAKHLGWNLDESAAELKTMFDKIAELSGWRKVSSVTKML